MKTYIGESIYKCTECDDSGVQDGNLKSHMRTYTWEKLCKCTKCDYWCIQDRHLKRHLKLIQEKNLTNAQNVIVFVYK